MNRSDEMAEQRTEAGANKWTPISDREIRFERTFDAPRELVFRAYTDPALIPQWWGPGYLTTIVEVMEVWPGGRWRYIQRDPDGNEYAFHGEYREVMPPERLVSTFVFEGEPTQMMVDSATFEDLGGKTRLTVVSSTNNPEALKGMLESGMQEGANETYDRLAALVAELAGQSA
jgi:uncharacterized protein YndB with AHSA1/START domain